jgi:hypothetical protein
MVDLSCVFEHWTVSILARVDEQEDWAEDSVQVHSLGMGADSDTAR